MYTIRLTTIIILWGAYLLGDMLDMAEFTNLFCIFWILGCLTIPTKIFESGRSGYAWIVSISTFISVSVLFAATVDMDAYPPDFITFGWVSAIGFAISIASIYAFRSNKWTMLNLIQVAFIVMLAAVWLTTTGVVQDFHSYLLRTFGIILGHSLTVLGSASIASILLFVGGMCYRKWWT